MQVVFTVQAEHDLEEIGDYIAADNPRVPSPSCARSVNVARRLLYRHFPTSPDPNSAKASAHAPTVAT